MKIAAINSVYVSNISRYRQSPSEIKNVYNASLTDKQRDRSLISFGISAKSVLASIKKAEMYQEPFKVHNGNVFIFSGFSGVGKDTILKAFLAKHPDYKLSVSYTTRPIRDGETNGKDYYFISDEDFQQGIESNEFLEWETFSGYRYGTKKASLENMLRKSKNLILKLDTTGALKVKKIIPDAKLIFIAPPSMEELEARLRGRNTESEESIKRRLSAIKRETKDSENFDYIIINDTVDNAVNHLEKIFGVES